MKKISWEKTPYRGVFLRKIKEIKDPQNPKVPKYTIMALRVKPKAIIPPHTHQREANWTETIIFPDDGHFEISDANGLKKITANLHSITIRPNEVFGLKNINISDLYFVSIMRPGFTGYEEIREVKKAKKSMV